MRDITPKKRPLGGKLSGTGGGQMPPNVPKPPAKPSFIGAKVPVAKVNVDPPAPKKPLATNDDGPAVVIPQPERKKPTKPLFYAKDLGAKKKKSKKVRGKVGQKESVAILGILVLVIIAAGLAAVVFLPRADVKLVLRTSPLLVDQSLTLRPNGEGDGVVPGSTFFRELTIEGESPVNSIEVVGTKATGVVDIVNKAIEPQSIVAQSRLVTDDGILFYMTKPVDVPPNSRVSVSVEAAEAGPEGNIEAQELNFAAIPESAQSLVYAEAKVDITGGSGETVGVVKEDDLNQAEEAAGQKARDMVMASVREELPEGWTLMEESWIVETDEVEMTVVLGDSASEIGYKARAVVRVLGYEQEKLEEKLEKALADKLDEDFMLFPGPISFTTKIDAVDWDKGEAKVTTRVTHTTIPRLSLETLREKLAGRSADDAASYLEGLPGVRSVRVELSPFWVKSVPRLEKRIDLDLQPEQTSV